MKEEELREHIMRTVQDMHWDAKEWSRQVMVNQRIIETFMASKDAMNEEQLEYLAKLTDDAAKEPREKLLRFPEPIVVGSCIHKGGSGKTTCSVALADELAFLGYNVLFIDSDSQMDATSTLLPDGGGERELFNALALNRDIRSQICETSYDRLDIVPSSARMSSIEAMLMSQAQGGTFHPDQSFRNIMKDVIKDNYYDFVFVDMDKTVGYLNRTILNGCTYLLMTSECSFYNISGVAALMGLYNDIKASTNPSLELLGVVFNKVAGRKAIVKKTIQDFDESLPGVRFSAYVRMDANVEKAQWENLTLREYNRSCNARKDFLQVMDEFLVRVSAKATPKSRKEAGLAQSGQGSDEYMPAADSRGGEGKN